MDTGFFVDTYTAVYPKDASAQAIARERGNARAAGWQAVMDRVTAGKPVDRDMLNSQILDSFSDLNPAVKVTAVTRDANGEIQSTHSADVGARRLARDRLQGMVDALVAACVAQTKGGARVVLRG